MLKFPMVFWAFQRYFSSRGIFGKFKSFVDVF